MDSGEHEQQAKRLRLETNHADGAPHTNGAAAAATAAALQRASALLQLPPPGHRLALPEGWLDCPPVGQRLFCNHLLPCKVPLGRQFDAVLVGPLEASRFTPAEARRAVQSLSSVSAPPGSPFRPYAVAIIDLTKTERYYTPEQEGLSTARTPLQGPGVVKHVKIPCAGSDGPPTPSEVNQFIYWVDVLLDEALRSRRKAGDWPVILVHCTHGFNRTGAMLVHYAMRCTGARPDLVNAVARFADARTPGIYKEGYISGALTCSHACSSPRYMSASHTLPYSQHSSNTTMMCGRCRHMRLVRRCQLGNVRSSWVARLLRPLCLTPRCRLATYGVRQLSALMTHHTARTSMFVVHPQA